jgi:hypothetical protein
VLGCPGAAALPLPVGGLLAAAQWAPSPRTVGHLVVPRLAGIEPRSRHADHPPSSAAPDVTWPAHSGAQGNPGAQPGHPGHRHAL